MPMWIWIVVAVVSGMRWKSGQHVTAGTAGNYSLPAFFTHHQKPEEIRTEQ